MKFVAAVLALAFTLTVGCIDTHFRGTTFVVLDEQTLGSTLVAQANDAAHAWNDAAGSQLITITADTAQPHVLVTAVDKLEASDTSDPVMHTHVRLVQGVSNSATGFVLVLRAKADTRTQDCVVGDFVHEFGHMLGLQHSADQHSVMYPTETPTWEITTEDLGQVQDMWRDVPTITAQ